MFKPIYDIPVLNFVFRTGEAIPINNRHDDAQAYAVALEEIAQALTDGDLLCIFPEGKLTQDGEVGEFKKGIETIIGTTPAPVVPVALRGLWGSWFSPQDGLFKGRLRPFSRVEVAAAEPVAPADVDAANLRERVIAPVSYTHLTLPTTPYV